MDIKTGRKSQKIVEEFIIHPNRIKRIEQGEALVISRTVDTGFRMISVDRAAEFSHSVLSRQAIEKALMEGRSTYLAVPISGLKINRKPRLRCSGNE